MIRADYIAGEIVPEKRPYGVFEKEELIAHKYWKIPLRRGYTEIAKLLQLCKKHNAYVCGGYARYCASTNKYGIMESKDIDIFFETEGDFQNLLEEIYSITNPFSICIRTYETDYAISFLLEPSAFSYSHARVNELKGVLSEIFPIQLIKPTNKLGRITGGNLFNILDAFDISVCQAAIISPDEVLVSKEFKNKEPEGKFSISNIHNPFMTLKRVVKYSEKKYKVSHDSLSNLLTYYNKDKEAVREIVISDVTEYVSRNGES